MGSQLTKENQSIQSRTGRKTLQNCEKAGSNSKQQLQSSSIVIVNAAPSSANIVNSYKNFISQLYRPLIPIGQTQINPQYPHLLPQPIIDFGLKVEQELRTHAEVVQFEQSKIESKIREIDQQLISSAVTIGSERQRRYNKAVDNFGKFDEIDNLIQRVESDIENILTLFIQLNESLPESLGPQPNNPGCMSQQQNTANNFLNIYGRSASTGSAPSSSMFSLLGSSGSFIPPPTLDLNEFPSLGGSNSMTNFSSPSNSVGRPAYVGMVKEVVGNSSVNEFNIQSEDFPALPGALGGRTTGPCDIGGGGGGNPRPPSTPNSSLLHQFGSNLQSSHQDNSTLGPMSQQLQGSSTGNSNMTPSTSSSMVSTTTSTGSSVSTGNPCISTRPDSTDSCAQSTGNSNNQGTLTVSSSSNNNVSVSASNSGSTSNSRTSVGDKKSSVQITKDGNITNIPPGMLTDQFGMAGLVSLLQSTESSTNLFSLAIGYDITTINLNLNSKDRIYHNYPGPWNDKQLKPFEIDYPVPPEYLVHHNVRDKIADIKTNLYSEDLLFFLFYFFAGEQMQMLATNELYSRDWRFHKDEGIWLRRQGSPLEKNNNYERGTYIYFDPHNWAKMQKDMTVEYDRLETNYS